VVAAAVVLPPGKPSLAQHLVGVRDSKLLTARQRERLCEIIEKWALAWGVGVVPPSSIDAWGILPATRRAMALALQSLAISVDYLLIDYLPLPDLPLPQHSLVKGDENVLSIAAASIVAKVSRDRLMVELETQFPGYGFAQHKGYGTPQHRGALQVLGPCPIHRFSFAPLQALPITRVG
jgi:ribonuclease HII